MIETDTQTDNIAELPPREPRSKTHRWNRDSERKIAGTDFPDGNGRTFRDCQDCSIIKITVHPPAGFPWREWGDHRAKGVYFRCESTPPCQGAKSE